jgi:hypothetical protein
LEFTIRRGKRLGKDLHGVTMIRNETGMNLRRVPIQLHVKLRGMDANGKPFSQEVSTIDISAIGARLSGLDCKVALGEVIVVQCEDRKCRSQVVWIGQAGSAEAGQIGIRCLDPAECPWLKHLESSVDTPATASAPTSEPAYPQHDRRRFPRVQCSGDIRMTTIGDSLPPATARVSDISIGGCYIETTSPWPVGTELLVTLTVARYEIVATAIVRTSHAIMGNGVEFTSLSDQNRELLERCVASLATTPSLPSLPADGGGLSVEAKLEAVLDLLERKKILTREELWAELRRATRPSAK